MLEKNEEIKKRISSLADEAFVSEYLLKIKDYNEVIRAHITQEANLRAIDLSQVEKEMNSIAELNKGQQTKNLTGIGGWLILYLFSSALRILFNILPIYYHGIKAYFTNISCIISIAAFVLVCFSFMLILLKRKSGKVIAITASVVMIIVSVMAFVKGIANISEQLIFYFLRDLIINGIWIAYFLRSERVRLTFAKKQ